MEELVNRANEAGLSVDDFLQMAQLRGMPSSEVEKLRNRIGDLDLGSSKTRSTNVSRREPRQQMDLNEITQGIYQPQAEIQEPTSSEEIFGTSLFFIKKTVG